MLNVHICEFQYSANELNIGIWMISNITFFVLLYDAPNKSENGN